MSVRAAHIDVPAMPASEIIEKVVRSGGGDIVTVETLLTQSPVAARETLMLVLAIVALVPGASLFAGLILMLLAVPMLFGHDAIWLPRAVASHPISRPKLVRLAERVLPLLRWQERVIPSGAGRIVGLSRPLGGLLVIALSATLLVPLPLSNVPPALVIAMIATSYLETSGALLALAAVSAVASLAVTASAVWTAFSAVRAVL